MVYVLAGISNFQKLEFFKQIFFWWPLCSKIITGNWDLPWISWFEKNVDPPKSFKIGKMGYLALLDLMFFLLQHPFAMQNNEY